MPTVFIGSRAINLPRRIFPRVREDLLVEILNDIHHSRIKVKLRYLLDRGDIGREEIQAKVNELSALGLIPCSATASISVDPILEEAQAIAKELATEVTSEIQDRAKRRVEARYIAANAALGSVL